MVQLPSDLDCHQYFFIADDAAGESRFPEEGSYLVGACNQQDFPDMWVDSQLPIEGRESADLGELKQGIKLIGCSSATRQASGWAWVWMLGLIVLRRKE